MPKKEFRALERRRGGEKKPKSAPRFDFSYLFSAVVQIGVALCAVATVLYFAYHLINEFAEPVTTTPAVTVRQAAYTEANAYIIRDERPITSSHASGFIDMRVKEGERVGKGEILCDIYPAAEEQLRGEIALLDYEIALLETARENAASSGSIAAVGKEISKNYASVMDLIAEGRLADAGAISDSLRSSLSALAILSGEGGGISARLSALKEERAAAISRLGGSIATPRADAIGYFFSDCDGYENVFNADLIENFNNERFAAAIASSPEPTSLCIGKMVSSSKWYVAVALSAKENRSYRVGKSYNVIFSDNAGRSVSMKLEKSVYDENGDFVLLFSSPDPPEDFAYLRCQRVRIEYEVYEGYRVPIEAVRHYDGMTGVYTLHGGYVYFRRINVLHEGEGYFIVSKYADVENGKPKYYRVLGFDHVGFIREYDKIRGVARSLGLERTFYENGGDPLKYGYSDYHFYHLADLEQIILVGNDLYHGKVLN